MAGQPGPVRTFATGVPFTQWLKVRCSVPDITAMRSLRLSFPWSYRSTLSAPSAFRTEVRPPSLCHAPAAGWQRLMFWLLAPAPQQASPPLNRLPGVRDAFLRCLTDVPGDDARRLAERIGQARSLRELWHLRADLYRLVGLQHSQTEAEARLARLNRHFPTRAPRSAFAPL